MYLIFLGVILWIVLRLIIRYEFKIIINNKQEDTTYKPTNYRKDTVNPDTQETESKLRRLESKIWQDETKIRVLEERLQSNEDALKVLIEKFTVSFRVR